MTVNAYCVCPLARREVILCRYHDYTARDIMVGEEVLICYGCSEFEDTNQQAWPDIKDGNNDKNDKKDKRDKVVEKEETKGSRTQGGRGRGN